MIGGLLRLYVDGGGKQALERRQTVIRPLKSVLRGSGQPVVDQVDASLEELFTPRELEVLRSIAEGSTDREIAMELSLAEITVKKHVQSIISKLGVSDRTQAAVAATRLGLSPAASALLAYTLSPAAPPVYWWSVAEILAKIEDDAMRWEMARTLASQEVWRSRSAETFHEDLKRAKDYLESWNGELEQATELLLSTKDKLEQRFGIAPWDAYWTILDRAFRSQVSPLGLAQSVVREVEEKDA